MNNDSINVKDVETGIKTREQTRYYLSSVSDIWYEATRPLENGGFPGARDANGDIVMCETVLRNLLPKQLRRMTDSQKQMCACDDCCIIANDMVANLNAWETRQLTSME